MEPKTLALFDFDGTITSKDSMFDFLKYASGKGTFYLKLFQSIPDFVLMLLKVNSNSLTKQKLLRRFLTHKPTTFWKNSAQHYAANELNKIVKASALEALTMHQQKNHRVIIVSASAKLWLKDWCQSLNVELLATELETINGFYTGKILGQNCNQQEKVTRVKNLVNINDYAQIIAYGDSKGDIEMLSIATQAHYRKFK